jgi:diguanylate cyclase (GGDEF)-like protein
MPTPDISLKRLSTGWIYALLAVGFILSFTIAFGLIWADQEAVIEKISHLQNATMPEIVRHQRLARNLEQFRRAGERIFSASTPAARQQAMFVVSLAASHPSVLEHREAALQTRELEHFLVKAVRDAEIDPQTLTANFAEWQRLSTRLGLLADDISLQGVSLVNDELDGVLATVHLARITLTVLTIVIGVLLVLRLIGLRQLFVLPLRHIDKTLSSLNSGRDVPHFKPSRVTEIQAIKDAITRLHGLLVENEKTRQVLEALANRDGLTGLFNRRHFMLTAETELHRAQRYRRPVTVGMADLDLFKHLNDTYGHAAGDTVLRSVAGLLQETLRQSDLVCRYGGEEFAFLFPEVSVDDAAVLAERCRTACAEQSILLADGRSVRITFSMGLSDASDSTLESALNRADQALYEAKRQGRNRVVLGSQLARVGGIRQTSGD